MRQEVEDLGFDWQQVVATTQLASVRIERLFLEEIAQTSAPKITAAKSSLPVSPRNRASPDEKPRQRQALRKAGNPQAAIVRSSETNLSPSNPSVLRCAAGLSLP